MKKSKRLFATILLFIFSFANLSSISFAAQTDVPDDFINMSIQQRIDWIDANVAPIYHEGTLISTARYITRTYSGQEYSTAQNAIGQDVYTLTTGFEWTVNSDDLSIESYRVTKQDLYRSQFAPIDYKVNPTVESYHLFPDNVKLYSQVEIVVFAGGYSIGHDLNLHGNGRYSFRPVSLAW